MTFDLTALERSTRLGVSEDSAAGDLGFGAICCWAGKIRVKLEDIQPLNGSTIQMPMPPATPATRIAFNNVSSSSLLALESVFDCWKDDSELLVCLASLNSATIAGFDAPGPSIGG